MFYGSSAGTGFWWIVALQTMGILCACLVRFGLPARLVRSCHAMFLGLLALMAAATLVALSISPMTWFYSSAALSVMVLVVLVDFGDPRRARVENRSA
jgi:hypothetical protein